MFEYKQVQIDLQEGIAFCQSAETQEYSVTAERMVFSAHCKYGTTFAKDAPTALADCKTMIDRVV